MTLLQQKQSTLTFTGFYWLSILVFFNTSGKKYCEQLNAAETWKDWQMRNPNYSRVNISSVCFVLQEWNRHRHLLWIWSATGKLAHWKVCILRHYSDQYDITQWNKGQILNFSLTASAAVSGRSSALCIVPALQVSSHTPSHGRRLGGEDLFSHGVLAEQGGHHRPTLPSGPGDWFRHWRTLIRCCKNGGNPAYELCLGLGWV